MKLVSWQPVLTDHQSYTFRELQKIAGEPIQFVVGAEEDPQRAASGWAKPNLDDLAVTFLPGKRWWSAGIEILKQTPEAVHLFNSMWGDRRFLPLFAYAQFRGHLTGLVTEPYSDVTVGYLSDRSRLNSLVRFWLRPLVYRAAGAAFSSRTAGVFAISQKAVDQFSSAGFSKTKLFPFGYFVPRTSDGGLDGRKAKVRNAPFRIIYVGSMIARKNVRSLVRAVEQLVDAGRDIVLDLYGNGHGNRIGSRSDRINWRGPIPFGSAQSVIRDYDALVLPSIFDGWGVVVNEAILSGVPVICSAQAGASSIVSAWGCGRTFDATNLRSLTFALDSLIGDESAWTDARNAVLKVSPTIEPSVAAKYVYGCLLYMTGKVPVPPACPWY